MHFLCDDPRAQNAIFDYKLCHLWARIMYFKHDNTGPDNTYSKALKQ